MACCAHSDFDFEELRQENPFLGPMMFFLFTLLGGSVSAWPHSGQQWKSCNADRVGVGTAVFVLVNMFIAILSEACASPGNPIHTKARAAGSSEWFGRPDR